MSKYLIKGGIVHSMLEEPFVGDVLLIDKTIAAIAPCLDDAEAEQIDARGLHVLPGLIDAHSHIGLFDFNHEKTIDDANEMTHPVSAAMDARYSMNPLARELKVAYEHGITAMLFTPGSGDVFCGQAFVAKTYGTNVFEMTVKAPAAVKIALGGNPKNTYGDRNQLPMTRMGVAHVLFDTLRKAEEYLKNKNAGKEQEYDAQLEAIIPALQGELPCKIHCTQYDMLTAIEVAKRFGLRFSLEHAWGADVYLDEIVESGCDVCFGPIGMIRSSGEYRNVEIEAIKQLDDSGLNVALVTDSPILSEESLYHHIGEAVRVGVEPERALRMVTINPARQLGVEGRIGCLAEGRDADVILIRGQLGLDTNAKVMMTIVDGKIVYRT